MAKALVITEKPSVARDIADGLGGFREEEGWFERDDLVVTFAVGHLYELLAPEELDDKYKRWTLDVLPILPEEFGYKVKKGQTDRIRTIQRLLRRDDVDSIVNACDAGREGELIFREIVENLGSDKPVRRLWLQSMTDDAIRAGFRQLRRGEELQGLADAAACRAQSDWLIGMNATRALTKRLKSRKEKTSWSAGRVQTPTLAMLVDKEFEVLAHVPRPFWRVAATFEHEDNRYPGNWFDPAFEANDDSERKDDRIFDAARAAAIAAAVGGAPATASETRKPSRESAPPLFDLTSLQREANRRFSWSARRTLSAAQRCYERHKVLTYPRTSSKCLPEDYRDTVAETLTAFAENRRRDEGFADLAAAAARLRENGLENDARIFDNAGVTDHFAIVPTGSLPRGPLTGDDKRLFDLVARRFLGAFHPAAQWERVERTTVAAGESFRTRARTLVVPGWRSVLADRSDGEEETPLPALVAGAEEASDVAVRALEATSEAEETKPPARITEARLLSLMENAGQQIDDEDYSAALHEKGIGTPATRADIIENLIGKGYVVRIGKALRPTVKGIRMIDTLRRIHIDRLTSPELTGEIEFHLLQVERGGRTRGDFMGEITDYTVEIVDRAKSFGYDELYDANETFGNCPNCGRPVIEMAWFYRCREEPARDPDCPLRFWKDVSGRYLDKRTVRALIANGTSGEIDGFTARNGRTYRGTLTIDTEAWKVDVKSAGWNDEATTDTPEYEVDPEPLGRCPFEEDCAIVESPTLFVCERKLKESELTKEERKKQKEDGVPQSCGFVMPRTVCKREITREEAEFYLRTGKTELLTDFTSRFGRPFSATLVLKDTGRHGFEFPPRKRAGDDENGGANGAEVAAPAPAAPKRARAKKAAPPEAPAPAKPAAAKPARKKAPRKKRAASKKSAAAEE
ncbi:MAG: DNA topoisomerase III [Deltaproteobacteria bacterium]|nr:MAG: DNA topoisomerase III [Deltaproteobacteria bacterium]